MDLITSLTVIDWVAGVSAVMIFGSFSSHLGELMANLWLSSPTLQAFGNNTLVFLKNTEVVWKPVVDTSLVVLRPISAFALTILKPFGPFALAIADSAVRGMVITGILITRAVLTLVRSIQQFMNFTKTMGVDFAHSLQAVATVLKDFTFSFAKIVNWAGYFFFQSVKGVSFVLDSFDQCGQFFYRILFEAHKLTWNDVYNISIPLVVVTSVLGLLIWRFSNKFASKPVALSKKFDDECSIPRRSSRLARKRAMLICKDLDSSMLTTSMFASKESSSRPSNL